MHERVIAPVRVVAHDHALTAAALVAWVVVIVVGATAAGLLALAGHDISIGAPPLHARLDPVVSVELVLACLVGVVGILELPRLAVRASWRTLVPIATVGAGLFGVALAAVRGWDRIVAPVLAPREYLAAVPRTADAASFLESFVHRLPHLPVHVQGHPPGPVLLGLGLRELGLGAPSWFAGVLIAAGTLVVPAALVTVREVAGEAWARRALPFLVLGPAAVWMVTSADALFAGVGALGVALVTLATRPRRSHRSRDVLALVGGIVLGLGAFLSYGLVLLAVVPLVIAWRRGAWRAIALATLGALVVVLAFSLAGFWWFDGLAATRRQYLAGIASRRPYLPFLAVDLAAFALVIGPATAVGLARLRDRRLWLVVGGGLLAVAVALLSGMAKGEVERIWLPFAPWLVVAAAAVWSLGDRRRVVGLLGLQVGAAILLEALVRTPW